MNILKSTPFFVQFNYIRYEKWGALEALNFLPKQHKFANTLKLTLTHFSFLSSLVSNWRLLTDLWSRAVRWWGRSRSRYWHCCNGSNSMERNETDGFWIVVCHNFEGQNWAEGLPKLCLYIFIPDHHESVISEFEEMLNITHPESPISAV